MDSLSLIPPGGTRASAAPIPPEPKSPGLAFLLSLAVPGLGQFYCGERKRAGWTFLFFAIGATCAVYFWGSPGEGSEILLGLGLRTAVVLYGFSFLDAYFTAREKSDGTHSLVPYNPRIAAVLNLLTRGFGYWYVDEKRKGVALFVVVGIANRVGLASHDPKLSGALQLFVEIALAAMAVDAYRVAKRNNEKALPTRQGLPAAVLPASGLKPALPLALAALLTLGYLMLVLVGVLMPEEKAIDQSLATIERTADGSVYVNRKYGMQLGVPNGWTLTKGHEDEFAEADFLDGACSVTMTRETGVPFITVRALPNQLLKVLQKQQPAFRLMGVRPSKLAGKSAHDIVYEAEVEGIVVTQTYVYTEDGFWITVLVATIAEPVRSSCEEDVRRIREQVQLPH